MRSARRSIICATTLLTSSTSLLAAQAVLSPFEGSVEKGIYESDFDALTYTNAVEADPTLERVEGSIMSRVLVKPESKSNLEVFRSYERELTAAGFTIHLAATPEDANPQSLIRQLYRTHNDLSARSYRKSEEQLFGSDLNRLATFGQYYLVASRTQGGEAIHVGIVLCRELNLYLIDELTAVAMETGTVTINVEAMRSAIEETGKIAIYDIHFATGSATIEPESATALEVIASYLSENGGGFYVVGHTDDTGTLAGNITLSEERAAAVKAALVADYGVDATRLEARGVGPLTPVSNNTGDAGRALNRRVEIVQRLRGG